MDKNQLDLLPKRKHPIHWPPRETGNRSIIVYLTVCAMDRKPILATPETASAILLAWQRADAWLVGRYVIMPDHLHLFCAPARHEITLKRWVKYWKALASKGWPQSDEHPIWQDDFWDTQLRCEEGYASKWEYVRLNPVRKGLVDSPELWPFGGEQHPLFWHE
jgi:putative transposase